MKTPAKLISIITLTLILAFASNQLAMSAAYLSCPSQHCNDIFCNYEEEPFDTCWSGTNEHDLHLINEPTCLFPFCYK